MAAYASQQREPAATGLDAPSSQLRVATASSSLLPTHGLEPIEQTTADAVSRASIIEQLLDRVADRIAATVLERLDTRQAPQGGDEWFDSRHAAEYLGVHRDTLRKLAAERAIPSEQDGPGCKLYFRRSDLDAWRRSGGRPRHLSMTVASAA